MEHRLKPSDMTRFVVLEHNTTVGIHYDFAVEVKEVLKSWIFPRRLCLEGGKKRLAVEVENRFSPDISLNSQITLEDEYGEGVAELWDLGDCEIESQKPHRIVLLLRGKRLKGRYAFFLPGWGMKSKRRQWLFFRLK